MYTGQSNDDLLNMKEIKEAFNEDIGRINKSLSEHERITRFRFVSDEWSPMTGELSASLKLKRHVIETRYKETLEEIYSRVS